jgi:magnesium-transporting ATPase (P-type)
MDLSLVFMIFEVAIVGFCIFSAIYKKKFFAYGFGFAFLIYAFYDFADFFNFPVQDKIIYFMFFLAAISALLGAILMAFEKTNKPNKKYKN